MSMTRSIVWMFSAGLMVLGPCVVSGQDYPNKTIRMVTTEPASGNDLQARLIAQGISGPLGQPVILENRGGNLSGEIVVRGTPDGYTLLAAGSSFWVGPLLQKTPYDPVRDFSPITLISMSPLLLVVHPSVPVKSVQELIGLAKAKPGELNYASGAIGGSVHLAGELFKAMAGVNIVRIPYKGAGPAVNAVISGEVQLSFPGASAAPHVKSGRLRALAVTSAQPSALVPGLPTVAASGLPGYESGTMLGIFAPAKTPAPIISRLNQEIVRFILNQPDVKQKFFDFGAEIVGSSPEGLAAAIKSEVARLHKVIKDAGIRLD